MKLNKVLPIAVAVLASALLVQLAMQIGKKPRATHFASWKNNPRDIGQAKGLAKSIVTGVVTKVERGNDLVMKIAGEPGGEDRIPIEVATIRIEKSYRGAPAQEVKVFRTGSTKDPRLTQRPPPDPKTAPPKPAGGIDRPAQLPQPTEAQARTILLEDDPPYRIGERAYLLLEDGPDVVVAGAPVKTQKPISPSGRFHVTADRKIQPVAISGFALQLRNMPEAQFENMLK